MHVKVLPRKFIHTGSNWNSRLGFAAYHTSIEVWDHQIEYGMDENGRTAVFVSEHGNQIFAHVPTTGSWVAGTLDNSKYGSLDQVLVKAAEIAKSLGPYHIFRSNCNHFADALCFELTGTHLPSYINRSAKWLCVFT